MPVNFHLISSSLLFSELRHLSTNNPSSPWFLDHLLIENILSNERKSLINIDFSFHTSFKEPNIQTSGQLLSLFSKNLFIRSIALIFNQDLYDIRIYVYFYLLYLISNVVEAVFVSTVIGQDDSYNSFIVFPSDCPESFLTGYIPNKKFDILPVHIYVLGSQVYTEVWTIGKNRSCFRSISIENRFSLLLSLRLSEV